MSEISHFDSFEIHPTREERVRVFLGDHLNASDQELYNLVAESFHDPIKPMANTAVLIPVAAQQDVNLIHNAMEQYSKQRGHEPFTIFMLLNAPTDSDLMEVSDKEVQRVTKSFPELDIRSIYAEYSDPSIGGIRFDLWNSALMLAYHEKLIKPGKPDIIGINHDIDVNYISPHYIKRVQQYYEFRQSRAAMVGMPEAPLRPAGTRVSHSVLPSHPNVGKVTQWVDNTYFQMPERASYEAGIVIPFSWYTLLGGFDPMNKTHETSWINDGTPLKNITSAQLYTSPRRYIDRLEEHRTTGIWTPDSFGTSDDCRESLKPDISTNVAEELIIERLHRDMVESWMYGALHGVYSALKYASHSELKTSSYVDSLHCEAENQAAKQHAKAARFLRKIVGSEALAEILEFGFDAKQFAHDKVDQLVLLNTAFYEHDDSLAVSAAK
jgi:hypothetical protein